MRKHSARDTPTYYSILRKIMEINRKYFKKSGTVYAFPVGFIQDNDVFDKEFIAKYNAWYSLVVTENRERPVGIQNLGGSVASYVYYLQHEIPTTAVYIDATTVLGGL